MSPPFIPPYNVTLRMYFRGQEEYEVGSHCVNLRIDPERDFWFSVYGRCPIPSLM